MTDPVNIVIPVKGFRDGKSRLAGALTQADRCQLNRYLAERTLKTVLAAAVPDARILVISPDGAVEAAAERHGAEYLQQTGTGLNEALSDAAARLPAVRTIYVAADLPDLTAEDVSDLAGLGGIVICPDEAGRGTNILSLPAPATIPFRFGPGSFAAHRMAADETGLPVEIVRRPGTMFDLDKKADLSRLKGWP